MKVSSLMIGADSARPVPAGELVATIVLTAVNAASFFTYQHVYNHRWARNRRPDECALYGDPHARGGCICRGTRANVWRATPGVAGAAGGAAARDRRGEAAGFFGGDGGDSA